jgi:anti-anti-sigma factor
MRVRQMTVDRHTAKDAEIDCGAARLRPHARSLATVVAISGEIDASNADDVSQHLRRFLSVGTALILDLSDVECIGVQGLRALFALDDECARSGVEWALVASHPVNLMLRAADPDDLLPVLSSLAEALQWIRNPERQSALLRLVTGAARVKNLAGAKPASAGAIS